MSEQKATIIIKKIKKGGHGHHGGAWKVAYADFVTAMMAFFLLMWLLSSVPKNSLDGLAQYFNPTIGLKDEKGIGVAGGKNPDEQKSSNVGDFKSASVVYGAPSQGPLVKMPNPSQNSESDSLDAKNFVNVQNDLYKAIENNNGLKDFKESVLVDQTPEGLRIQLLDNPKKPMFIPGTNQLQEYTKQILKIIAPFVKYLPNYMSIDGHTNASSIRSSTIYDDWTLSSERANETRKFLLSDANIDPDQILRITGKANQEPLDPLNPDDIRNMRISIILLKNSIAPYQKQPALDKDLKLK